MNYLRNCWYIAAWDSEVKAEEPLGRTLIEEPIVLYRDSKGATHALADRCPHRFAPLHMGKVHGDALQCSYHGLKFGPNGQCVHNPHGNGAIPAQARVRSYPVVERQSLVWVWMGDPERADPELIPDFPSLDPTTQFVGKDYLHARAHYQLEIDNIMDLSHIDFLHPSTLGGAADDRNAETSVVQEGRRVWSYRLSRNELMSPELYARNGLEPGTRVDRWLDVRWEPPGVMELHVGFALPGAPEPRKAAKALRVFQHLFSPETATTTHYWFGSSLPRAMGPHGEKIIAEVVSFLRKPFESEDLPMLEAQQRTMRGAAFWDLKPILLPTDAPGVRARRVLDQLIAEENRGADASSAGTVKPTAATASH